MAMAKQRMLIDDPSLSDAPVYTNAWAEFSEDGARRFILGREWSPVAKRALWVMLNPSKAGGMVAGEVVDDPTIRRCVGFSKREGCGSMEVVNLYPLIATDPKDLYLSLCAGRGDSPGETDWHALQVAEAAAQRADVLIAAWGSHRCASFEEADYFFDYLSAALGGRPWHCLGVNKDGAPKHPLYLGADTPLIQFHYLFGQASGRG